MRFSTFTAVAASILISAGSAHADVLTLSPTGDGHTLDFYIPINKGGDFSVRFSYDEAAFSALQVRYFLQGSLFAYFPCGPDQLCLHSESGLDLADAPVDPQVAGTSGSLYGSARSPLTWTPNSDGFTLNFYGDNHCYSQAPGPTCHQIESLSFVSFYGAATSDQPIRFEVTYGPAAVPEPATWAMMIAGFGLVGSTLRRRRVIAA